jgi:hypothetical protein
VQNYQLGSFYQKINETPELFGMISWSGFTRSLQSASLKCWRMASTTIKKQRFPVSEISGMF